MYLYEVYVNNGMIYDDEIHFTKIVVAEDEDDALEKVKCDKNSYCMDYEAAWWDIRKLDVIDNYNIFVKEKSDDEIKCITVINDESKLKELMFQCVLKGYRNLKLRQDADRKWIIECL